MNTSEYDFDLPAELIAQQAVEPRDSSRLMVLRVGAGTWEHRIFSDLPEFLQPTDLLVRNNTRVVPARLFGTRERTGGKWEGLFLKPAADGRCWEVLARTGGHPTPGEWIRVGADFRLKLVEKLESGSWIVEPDSTLPADVLLEKYGQVPLPPYIRKGIESPGDRGRYQTVYAKPPGSVAAPTAGLHFTPELLARLERKGIQAVDVTLHVGLGTFRPIEADTVEAHVLHAERAEVTEEVADRLRRHKASGGRIVTVGTTSTRTLEAAAVDGTIRAFSGETALYIKPGHCFHAVDVLITNFHLPKSSLLVLVSALTGLEFMRAAYREAIREGYRFYSYGDAMLILP